VSRRLKENIKRSCAVKGKNLKDTKGKNVGYMTKSPDYPKGLRGNKYSETARFLRCAMEEYAIVNAEVHRANGEYDFPFCHHEKQNQPIVWHCLRRTSPDFSSIPWAEQRWDKKRRGKAPQHQYLDYVVSLGKGGEIVLWIEYKHRVGYLNQNQRSKVLELRSVNGLSNIAREWDNDRRNKLEKMDPNKYKDLWYWSGSKSKLVKVNLLIMPICVRMKTNRDRANNDVEGKGGRFNRSKKVNVWVSRVREKLKQHMKSPINWHAAWALHSELLQNPIEWEDDNGVKWSDSYPAVFFFAQVLRGNRN